MTEPALNRTYEVSFADCCVSGSFIATLTEIKRDRWDRPIWTFTNGVTITAEAVYNLVTFTEVKP